MAGHLSAFVSVFAPMFTSDICCNVLPAVPHGIPVIHRRSYRFAGCSPSLPVPFATFHICLDSGLPVVFLPTRFQLPSPVSNVGAKLCLASTPVDTHSDSSTMLPIRQSLSTNTAIGALPGSCRRSVLRSKHVVEQMIPERRLDDRRAKWKSREHPLPERHPRRINSASHRDILTNSEEVLCEISAIRDECGFAAQSERYRFSSLRNRQ